MKNLCLLIFFFLALCQSACSGGQINSFGDLETGGSPRLLYPVTDDITLDGKDALSFKWLLSNLASTDHFELKIYKGYNMYEANLIYKAKIKPDIESPQVPASLFTENQVYTWSLRQVFIGGRKGDKGFSSFKIIRK